MWGSTVASARSSCRLSTSWCCRWWNSTLKCSAFSAVRCLRFPSRLSKCPTCLLPVCAVQRAVPLEPQMVEQLLEVPTCFYKFEQNADIPVPLGRGARGGLQGFHAEQGSAASFPEQIVDIPVHSGGLRGFLPRQSLTALRRLPTFLLPLEVFKVFSQNSIQQHVCVAERFPFQFRMVVAEVVEVFKIFAHNRVQQRRFRRSLTFLQVEGLTVFYPDRVPQRPPLSEC